MRAWGVVAALIGALALVAVWAPRAVAEGPIKVGFGMALTGGVAGNGKAALLAIQIWAEEVNKKGGLLGRKVELVYYDDQSKAATVPGIYTKLLDVDKVDLVVSGYGTNLIAPALPIVIERKLTFIGLFGLAVNEQFHYPHYFGIMPAGPSPKTDWSAGFFEIAGRQNPKPRTVALVGADAEYGQNALAGARENAKRHGLQVVYDKAYPPATVDFTPIVRAIQATNPDIVFVASYPPDSAGMLRAAHEVGLKPKLFGGGMVGLQYASLQTALGLMLEGVVNYDFWVPEPTLKFPGIEDFLKKYQERAKAAGVDPLGHYVPPWAYAYLQVLGQAVEATKSLDQQKIGEYIRTHEHDTLVGKIRFAPNGEWVKSRVLMVQFQNIENNSLKQFGEPGHRVVIYPDEWKSGTLIYPYAKAKR
ncbi:MAG: amino acid ABC transporter substrate-binding protein [Candidatus Rokubacteria bacterium]|nr:amino acid ABC transporter substrate-binding protein [Candidatus Rokubacteria bacterium]